VANGQIRQAVTLGAEPAKAEAAEGNQPISQFSGGFIATNTIGKTFYNLNAAICS